MTGERVKAIDEALLTKLIQELVRIPTQNPPGREKAGAEFIRRTLSGWGIETELVTLPDPERPQVLAVVHGEAPGKTLVLNGHIDVVPEGLVSQWQDGPYGGVVRDGRVYGRGSADMKAGLAVMMALGKLLREKGLPKGTLVLQFSMGEETGLPGTRELLAAMERKGIRGDFGVVLEPTLLKVATAEKGLVWFRITLEGKPAHGSVAEQGINAIEKAVRLGEKLIDYDRRIRTHVHPLLGSRKCTMTLINAGTKENVVPERCSMILDRRFNPDETAEGIEKELRVILDGLAEEDPDFRYGIERTMVYDSAEVPVDAPLARVLRRHVLEVTGIPSEPFGMMASTDVRNFIHDAGIPAVNFGPGDLRQAHTFDEYVEIRQALDCMKILLGAIEELL